MALHNTQTDDVFIALVNISSSNGQYESYIDGEYNIKNNNCDIYCNNSDDGSSYNNNNTYNNNVAKISIPL